MATYRVKVTNIFGSSVIGATFKVTILGNSTTYTTDENGVPKTSDGIIYTYDPMSISTFEISKTGYNTQSGNMVSLNTVFSSDWYKIILYPSGITDTTKCPTYSEIAEFANK